MTWSEEEQNTESDQGMNRFERIGVKKLEEALSEVISHVNGTLRTKINDLSFDEDGRIIAIGPRCEFVKLPEPADPEEDYEAYWMGYQFMMPDFYRSREKNKKDYTVTHEDSSSVQLTVTPERRSMSVGANPFAMRVLELSQFRDKCYDNLGLESADVNRAIHSLDEYRELVKDNISYKFMHEVGEHITKKNKLLNFRDKQHAWDVFEGSIDEIIERLNSPEFKKSLIQRAMNQYETITNIKENLLKTTTLLQKHGNISSEIICYETALRFFTELMTMEEVSNPKFWDNMPDYERKKRFQGMREGLDKEFFSE